MRERGIRMAAGDHLGKIAMHDADATRKVRRLGGEEGIGCGPADQLVDSSAIPGMRASFLNRIRQRDPRTRACHISESMNPKRIPFADKQREAAIFCEETACGSITAILCNCRSGSGPAITMSG